MPHATSPTRSPLANSSDTIPSRPELGWAAIQASFLARSFTSRQPESSGVAALTPEPDTATRIKNARIMLERLEHHAGALRAAMPQGDPQLAGLMRAVVDGDHDELARLGIDMGHAWIDDILTALVAGAPFVEIETVGPYAAHHLDGSGALDVSSENLSGDERAGILLAAILRDAFDHCANLRIVALLDDLHDPLGGRHLPVADRDRYVVQMSRILYEHGVLRQDDVPGDDYLLLRESESMKSVDSLVDQLADSGRGVIEHGATGDITFWPSKEFIAQLALGSSTRRREFARRGILIRRNGRATCQAIDAAGFLDPVNRHVMHVVMLDARFAPQQDKTYALLRAIDMVHQDSYHNGFFDAEKLQPEVIALVVCRLLISDLERLLALLGRFDEWEAFDADEYRERNYGRKVLPEDQEIIDFVVDRLAALAPEPAASAIDVGAGPNLYPAMLVAPYVATDGTMTLLDYASANLASLEQSLRDVGSQADSSPWARFESLMSHRDPRYAGVAGRLPSMCQVAQGSIYALPEAAYDLVTSFFVAESITTSRRDFRIAIRSLCRALRVGGVLVLTHMVGSIGYHAGEGTRFPAVRLMRHDIEQACRDADLDFTLHQVSHEDEKARSGYQGMAAIVARRTR